nr:hypothetical protein [Tanacetum cinerariifolium]
IRAIRILIAIAAYYDYEIWQMDVKTAFLNGYLNEEASGSNITFLILYVDDILIMGNSISMLQSVKTYLGKCFAIKDLGEAAYNLLIKIYIDRSKQLIGLCQSAYIEKILKRYCMENSKRGSIPMQEKLKLSKSQGASTPAEIKRMQNVPYASAVGSIMYAVRCTHPDTGYVCVLNGGAVDWKSAKQSIFATLSVKAEYIAAFDASKEAKHLSVAEGLRVDLEKYWILAYSSGPQFVIGRSAPCTASGESCYKWSTTMVLISQTIEVGIGTISPTVRWFMAINFSCLKKAKKAHGRQIGVEKYWIKKLLLLQMKPLDLNICGWHGRKLAHKAKYQIFSIYNNDSKVVSQHGPDMNLSRFVIHLDGEDELVDLMMKNNGDATAHWIKIGENQKPKNLVELLEKVDSSLAFTGAKDFDSDKVPSLGPSEPPIVGLSLIAEEIIWSEVELDGRWLEVDLNEMALQGKGVKETIKALSDILKEKFTEYADTFHPYERVHVNSKQCRQSGIEEREQNIRNAVLFFGITQGILRILDKKKIQESNPGQLVHIDDWHLLCKKTDTISSISCSTDKESAMSSLYISIE